MIPVQRPYLGDEELAAVKKVFESRWLGMGSYSKEFEDKLKAFLGVKHAIAVNTGTSALHLALDVLGLRPGDEVIVPSLTFVASIQAIIAAGATPVFCDVDPDTLNMSMNDAFSRVTTRTKAIMPVHFGGLACDMDEVVARAHERSIRIVEDAAHAFGSSYKGRKVGTIGDLTCFSFDPIKNITCGEGGVVTTEDDALAAVMTAKRILGIDNDTWSRHRNQRNWFYSVSTAGFRYHLPNFNAAVGLEQLKRFSSFLNRKQAILAEYDRAFDELRGLALIRHDREAFPFFYVVRVLNGKRDALMDSLKQRGVATGVHYVPNHLQPLFAADRPSLPVTEQIFEEIVTLPLYFEMTDQEVAQVIAAVREFCGTGTVGTRVVTREEPPLRPA